MRCWGRNFEGQVMLLELFGEPSMFVQPFDLISLFDLSQLGDGSTTQQITPVGVVGLSSGVSSISLGQVRLTLVVRTLLSNTFAGVCIACVVFPLMICDAGCCALVHAHA